MHRFISMFLAVAAGVVAGCAGPREVKVTPPAASIATNEPCRYMGSLHRESRSKLEILRTRHKITMEEWRCMAKALASIDKDLTASCTERVVSYSEFQDEQRARYSTCLPEGAGAMLDEAISLDVRVRLR